MCARFVQVGNRAYNIERVETIDILRGPHPAITLWYKGGMHELYDEQAERFLAWWDNKAEVYKA